MDFDYSAAMSSGQQPVEINGTSNGIMSQPATDEYVGSSQPIVASEPMQEPVVIDGSNNSAGDGEIGFGVEEPETSGEEYIGEDGFQGIGFDDELPLDYEGEFNGDMPTNYDGDFGGNVHADGDIPADGDMPLDGDMGGMYDDGMYNDGMYDEGMYGEDGMYSEIGADGMGGEGTSSFKPLASWVFVIGMGAIAIALGVVFGLLLAKRKIKKGLDLSED